MMLPAMPIRQLSDSFERLSLNNEKCCMNRLDMGIFTKHIVSHATMRVVTYARLMF